MKPLLTIFLFTSSLLAQTAQFPTTLANTQNLGIVANGVSGVLNNSLTTSSTSANITNGTCSLAGQVTACSVAFQVNMFVTIQNEIMQVCSIGSATGVTILNFGTVGTSCPSISGRGLDGSQIAAHVTPSFPSTLKVTNNITAWPHNANSAEIIAIESFVKTGGLFNVISYGAKGNGSTDDTTAVKNGLTAAIAAGGCLYFPARSTNSIWDPTGSVNIPPTPNYKLSGTLTGRLTGTTCIIFDPSATISQTADVDTIDLTGSSNYILNGIISYTVASTHAGISIADTSALGAGFSHIINTRVYGAGPLNLLAYCFKLTSNYAGGSYQNDLLEIYGQFCGTGVYENGLGASGPSSNSFLNLGNVTGSIDNSTLAASFNNAGEKFVSLEMNGNANGILIDNSVAITVDITRGGEAGGYLLKFNSSGAFNNTIRSSGVLLPGQIIDLSGGKNFYYTGDFIANTLDSSGIRHTCIGGCFTNQSFPAINPRSALDIQDPNSGNGNLLGLFNPSSTTRSWLSFNPYKAATLINGTTPLNVPFAGLYFSTHANSPASAPSFFTSNGNTDATATASISIGLATGLNNWMGGLRSIFQNSSVSGLTWTTLQAQASNTNGIFITTGTATSGSTALTIADGSGTVNGQRVYGVGVAGDSTVSSGGGTTAIVLSKVTVSAVSGPISFGNITDVFSVRGDGVFGGNVIKTVSTLPTCNALLPPSGTLLTTIIVSDLTTPTLGGTLTGGGAIRGQVVCGYNGSASAWHVSAF